jgi:putative sterol carrier protein
MAGGSLSLRPCPRYGRRAICTNRSNYRKDNKVAIRDIKEVFTRMPEAFNASAAQGMDAIFQLDITGEGGGSWNVVIKDGTCQINEGSHDAPNVTLTMSSETWLAIVNRQSNGMQAFVSGTLKVSGDIMLAQHIEKLFQL